MEKKNTILLTVIAVATLLVAVVGATFAYFTATNTNTGAGQSAEVTTNTVGSVDLTTAPTTVSNVLEYPGGYVVVGAEVTASDNDANNDFTVTYQVNGTIANNTSTQLNWTLYEVASEVATPVSGCELQQTQVGDEMRYTYGETCQVAAALTTEGGATEVTSGTVDANDTAAVVTAAGEKLTTTGTSDTVTYYYLVVEYPDTDANQDADQGKGITAALTALDNTSADVIQ